jgi:predicted aspartyl protease
MERILPALRDPAVLLPLTKIGNASDVAAAGQVVWTAIAKGTITPEEGEKTSRVLEMQRKTLELVDTEKRLILVENMGAECKRNAWGRPAA